jgi:hypothetical protein
MQTIKVVKTFVLTLEDHAQHAFTAGVYKVEDAIANHSYVKAHSEPVLPEGVEIAANPPSVRGIGSFGTKSSAKKYLLDFQRFAKLIWQQERGFCVFRALSWTNR